MNIIYTFFTYVCLSLLTFTLHAESYKNENLDKECITSQSVTIHGVGLLSRIPQIKKALGEPLRIEKADIPGRINGNYYYYKGLKILAFGTIAWVIDFTNPNVKTDNGIGLNMNANDIQKILNLDLSYSYREKHYKFRDPNGVEKYAIQLCLNPNDVVEEYIIMNFDQNHKLIQFSLEAWGP